MTKISILGVLFLCSLLIWSSCKKENDLITTTTNQPNPKNKTIIVGGSENLLKSDPNEKTILGEIRVNPYTVENMTAAWNQIYPNYPQTALPKTHLYVKFNPQSAEELRNLNEAVKDAGAFLYDYPLEYEVVEMGHYYVAPQTKIDEITAHYAVVTPTFSFSGFSHTIVDELVLAPYNSYLTAEAFRRTDNDYHDHLGNLVSFCSSTCAQYPACLAYNVGCEGEGGIQALPAPCLPGSSAWPFCLGINTPASPVGPVGAGGTTINACGCPINDNGNMPSGCVELEDSQLGWEGVKSVEVHIKDGWFMGRSVWTTNEGCWSINENFFGEVTGFVIWNNSRITVRGVRELDEYLDFFGYGTPVKQNLGQFAGAVNDIQIRHNRFPADADDRMERMFWFASTANNAAFEYDFYADQEGMGRAANNLEVLLANTNNDASAPMLSHLMDDPRISFTVGAGIAIGGVAQSSFSNFWLQLVPGVGTLLPPTGSVAYYAIAGYFVANVPDVVYSYGANGTAFPLSDRVKETFFHEYAHSAQYEGLTNDPNMYWLGNVIQIISNAAQHGQNLSYGLRNGQNYERTGIIEAWGHYIALFMTDLHYDELHSLGTPTDRNKWIYDDGDSRGEVHTPNLASTTNWIPWGVMWDLFDDATHNNPPLSIPDGVNDQVTGLTNAQLFNAVTNNSPEYFSDVRNAVVNNQPGQTNEINDLFTSYGF